jgi:hypothetical protein
MQYELFYPRLAEHEPNAFYRPAHPRKDLSYPKNQLSAVKTEEQPNRKFQFWDMEVLFSPAQVGHTGLTKVYLVKQKANSNGGLNLNTHDENPMCVNDKKKQQSTDINSGAWTGGLS